MYDNIGMDTRTFSLNVVTTITIPATMMKNTMTKQAFVFEDPRHCNSDGWPSNCYNVRYNDGQQS